MDNKFLNAEGIKYLWSKISMEDYPNNETLMAVINAIDETKADKEDIVSADWNASEGKPGHVLNRTHYEEIVSVENVVIAEKEETTSYNSSQDKNISGFSDLTNEILLSEQFIPGDTYIVQYDGVSYSCIAGDFQKGWLGNPVLHPLGIKNSLGEDNGLPFFICRVSAFMCQIGTSEPGTHTFKVTHLENKNVVHKLPEKFLPDSALAQPDWDAQDDEPGYILNKPEEITSDDALELLVECGIINPAAAAENNILVDENGNVLLV